MSNDLVTTQQHQPAPFGQGSRQLAPMGTINAGAVAIEQERAIAEAQGKLVLAKRFPRDMTAAHAALMAACKSPAFAAVAFYSKPQGGSTVSGPSIRMAEQIAQVYGNFDYGHRELSRDDRKSEIEVYAWDMQNNNYTRRQKTVLHVRDTRDGPKKLRDQTDIDQRINNIASKEMRGLILAMMPKWFVEDAVQECRKTLAGNNEEPLEARVRKMTQAFAKYGVTTVHLEKHLGHKLDAVLLDELIDLQGIFNSLRDGTPASELFENTATEDDQPSGVAETARKAAEAKTTEKAAPKPAAQAKKEPDQPEQPAVAPQQEPTKDAAEAPEAAATAPTPAPAPARQQRTASAAKPEVNSAQKDSKPMNAQAPAAEPEPAGQNGNTSDDSDFF